MPPRSSKARRVLARTAPEHFVGRGEQLREIASLAPHKAEARGLVLLAAPFAGASELLRQSFDELFRTRGGASPVYFAFTRSDPAAATAARRFLLTFLTQTIAHRRDDPALVSASPTLRGLLDLATPPDYEWVERLVESFERAVGEGDERVLVRVCLGAPQAAAARGVRTVVLFDDVHLAEGLKGEVDFASELAQAAAHAGTPFVLGGLRRRALDVLSGPPAASSLEGFGVLHLARLEEPDARTLAAGLAERSGVALNEETRDLVAHQLEGSPYLIGAMIDAARAAGVHLRSFRDFQRLYVDELLGGRINRRFGFVVEEAVPSPGQRRNLLKVLHETASGVGGKAPVESWQKRIDAGPPEFARMMRMLHAQELATMHATYVEAAPGQVWRDYLRASYRLHVAVEPRALVVADTLVETLKRAPQAMARQYRRAAALGLGELMRRFDFQRMPASLLHHGRFARLYRGASPEEVAAGMEAETELVRLPQGVHVASCASFHPPALQFCDEERCAVLHGFDSSSYTDSNEVVWLAAEVESKLEAGRALAELWLDRLSQVSDACGFGRSRVWLVSPEGFTEEACEFLNERGAFCSSRHALELLAARLGAGAVPAPEAGPVKEFALEIPMGEETEIIAAQTVAQIARQMEFAPESVNEIKQAIIEACINASEHSLSPDRKIYQRFRLEDDKLIITVSSRGLQLPAGAPENGVPHAEQNNGHDSGEGSKVRRRGWGLKLIRSLMDDVEFERVDDGTRLRMTKYLHK
ncbi:MAG TPA: ATP-binding protein [Pyrinomonadaceae bacterium]|nr:ATP-binding protein [Pyrinomonadaceae bacterium]